MIDKFVRLEYAAPGVVEHRITIGKTQRPDPGSEYPPTLTIQVYCSADGPPMPLTQSFERWPRIMAEIVRKLAEGRGETASHILDEMDAALFDGDGKLKP